ncbi:hypothetical protein [Vibrio japonicus]|uniref:Uncharacterized protein n=1 Tax=Vibrio japonicus TaxID=1824638 RepID=A0ABY5LDW7_9VIBR|nr:hypothetical protein [Vibrio japonicus]UUM29666.1 hypothetical protein NP165_08035 [Vibrio japonicus]
MLNKLKHRLAHAAENIAELENHLGRYVEREGSSCKISKHEVYLEYPHDLTFEEASIQAEALLNLCKIPSEDDGEERSLLLDISGKDGMTKLHFDLSIREEDDLLAQYICSQLQQSFKELAQRTLSTSTA